MNWDEHYLDMCRTVARKSKDRSTQCGCVIVGPAHEVRSTGYNGFARGVDDNPVWRHERPEKYRWNVHAEVNAIANAARFGGALDGATLYVSEPPCAKCAGPIINAGIIEVVYDICSTSDYRVRCSDDIGIASLQFKEAGVKVREE